MKKIVILVLVFLQIAMLLTSFVSTSAQEGLAVIFPADVTATRTADPDNRWITVDLPHASFMANLWNLAGGAQGKMEMKLTKTSAEVTGEWSGLPTTVSIQGSPGIRYGRNIWGGNPPAHALYRIPRKITELPYAIFFSNYTIYEKESTLPVTATLYLWTVKSVRDGGTRAGDVLIIVRTYRHPAAPLTSPPLLNVSAPLIVNGTLVYATFGVYASNIDKSADSHTSFVYELLTPIKSGRVGIPIPEFISLTASLLTILRPEHWTREDVLGNILQMIDYCIEWYSGPQGAGVFKWTLYEVSFLVGANVVLFATTVTQAVTRTQVVTRTVAEVSTVVQTKVETAVERIVETKVVTSTVERTATRTITSTTTRVETATQTVTAVDWTLTIGIAIVLLLVGIGIGYIVKKR